MTAEPSRAVLDRRDDGRGAVPHDDGAALSTVENGEAVGLPSVGGLVRGLAFTLAQARPVGGHAVVGGGQNVFRLVTVPIDDFDAVSHFQVRVVEHLRGPSSFGVRRNEIGL